MSALHLLITGNVQGVFFRMETKKKADILGIRGWVKNNADGSVEIHAEGSKEALDTLKAWYKEGPSAAQVSGIESTETTEKGFQSFTIED